MLFGLFRSYDVIGVNFRRHSLSIAVRTQAKPSYASYNLVMFARRRHRLITVLCALFSLLFMQLAVAGYVCPVDAKVAEADVMAEAAMPCAGEMTKVDAEQPGLCHAHCQSAQQTVEKAQTPTPAVAVATGFTYTIEPVRPSLPRQPAQAPSLMRSTAPPIAVRNCCFRI